MVENTFSAFSAMFYLAGNTVGLSNHTRPKPVFFPFPPLGQNHRIIKVGKDL